MSTRLFLNLVLTNRPTFISEDFNFLSTFYSLKKDLPRTESLKPKIYLLISVTILAVLDSFYFWTGLSILTSGLCLPLIVPAVYALLCFRFYEHRVKSSFNSLSTCLRENHRLLKKLLTLGQELAIIERNCDAVDSNSCKVVSSTFEVAVRLFNVLRDETKTALSLPATVEDVNREDNYISCLPNQLFEDLLLEEKPTSHQLKSLMQLVRIQQSEFLRRILCVHVSGTVEEKSKILCCIRNSLNRCQDMMVSEQAILESLFAFHQSSCFKQEQTPISSHFHHSSDVDHYIKSIRIHLHSAILLLNNIEKVASQDSTNKDRCISDDLLRIENELTQGSEILRNLSKKLRKNNEYSAKSIEPSKLPAPTKIRNVIVDENFQPPIEDQVFELFIDDDCLDLQSPDEDEGSVIMFDDLPSLCSNLFRELKTALIPKAEETREREAKALGIPKEKVSIQLDNVPKTLTEAKIPRHMTKEAETTNLIVNDFTSTLAAKAAQISKDLKLNVNEECFGDSDYDDCDVSSDLISS